MIRTKSLVLAAALALAAGGSLAAGARADEVNGRIDNQRDRIEQGVDNGSLTRGEARQLRHQDAKIARERQHMAKNGLTQGERKTLNHDLNRESNRIYDQRHDDQSR